MNYHLDCGTTGWHKVNFLIWGWRRSRVKQKEAEPSFPPQAAESIDGTSSNYTSESEEHRIPLKWKLPLILIHLYLLKKSLLDTFRNALWIVCFLSSGVLENIIVAFAHWLSINILGNLSNWEIPLLKSAFPFHVQPLIIYCLNCCDNLFPAFNRASILYWNYSWVSWVIERYQISILPSPCAWFDQV